MRLAGALPLGMLCASLPLVASGQQSNDPKKDEKPFLLASTVRLRVIPPITARQS